MGNPDTYERNGYKPINTNPIDELNLHEGEMPTGENENRYEKPKTLEDLTENACNRIDTGECDIPKSLGCDKGKYMFCFRAPPK